MTKIHQHPCAVVGGKHYYDPQAKSNGAVEALKASVEAASSHIVVANGSTMSPPRYPAAERTAAKNDFVVAKSAAYSQQTRPSSSDGSSTATPHSTRTSHAGSPRRFSDSTIRPNRLPSTEIDHGVAVQAASVSVAENAPQPGNKSPTVSDQV